MDNQKRIKCPTCNDWHTIDRRDIGSQDWELCIKCVENKHVDTMTTLRNRGIHLSCVPHCKCQKTA